jgi:hypothetical protein
MWYKKETKYTENMCSKLLTAVGVPNKLNNTVKITAVDIITENHNIDVQFVKNYKGTIYLDFISAFFNKPPVGGFDYEILNKYEKYKNIRIQKPGKYFLNNYVDYVFIFGFKSNAEGKPKKLIVLNRNDVIEYLDNLSLNRIIINNKKNLNDTWGSAFVPVKVNELENFKNSRVFDFNETLKDIKKVLSV